jgi:hypothetical protein
METMGRPARTLFCRRWKRPLERSSSSFSSLAIRSRILLRSTSSLVSPGPRPPIPPMRRDICTPRPVSLGRRYLSCASSTCTLPSWLLARRAKDVEDQLAPVNDLQLRHRGDGADLGRGELLVEDQRASHPVCRARMTTSRIFPSPIRKRALNSRGRWMTVSSTSTPAVRASSFSSSSEILRLFPPLPRHRDKYPALLDRRAPPPHPSGPSPESFRAPSTKVAKSRLQAYDRLQRFHPVGALSICGRGEGG